MKYRRFNTDWPLQPIQVERPTVKPLKNWHSKNKHDDDSFSTTHFSTVSLCKKIEIKNMKLISPISIVIFLISLLFCGEGLASEKVIQKISPEILRAYIQETLTESEIPGIAVSVFTGDTILDVEVDGVRKVNSNDSIKINDRFHLGSNGKAMTGVVAARLVERKLIKWETRIFEIFPELKETSNSAFAEVTFEKLLSHRSGVRQFTEDDEWALLSNFHGKNAMQKRYGFTKWLIQQAPVELDPIKKFTYSNAGYSVAAAMMEKVTGKQWENLIAEELFIPLKIKASFGWPALANKNQPWGHWHVDGNSALSPHPPDDQYQMDEILTPAGGYSLSILDYTRFLQINLSGINGNDNILKSTTYDYLHYSNFDPGQPLVGWYSIGWGVYKPRNFYTVSTHDGSAETFYCFAVLFKEVNLGIAIVTNAGENESKMGVIKLRKKIEKYIDSHPGQAR
jgi:CubicO group peptidase (beta-lactamase class C family)